MGRFNSTPNKEITDTQGNKHWISPSVSTDALVLVNGFVLIVKRSENMNHAGKWCLPCGYVEFNENFLDAAYRELFEETGIDIRAFDVINSDYTRPYTLNGTALQFVFELLNRPDVKLDLKECTDYAWVSTSMLKDYDFAFNHDLLINFLLSIR